MRQWSLAEFRRLRCVNGIVDPKVPEHDQFLHRPGVAFQRQLTNVSGQRLIHRPVANNKCHGRLLGYVLGGSLTVRKQKLVHPVDAQPESVHCPYVLKSLGQ